MGTLQPHEARRLGKYIRLAGSPVEGESRAAVAQAMKVVDANPEFFDGAKGTPTNAGHLEWPRRGTPEYFDALRRWNSKYEFLSVNRASPKLSRADVRLIRNVVRYRGLPDVQTARRVDGLCERLSYDQNGKE